jgi:heat shock protein HslJ
MLLFSRRVQALLFGTLLVVTTACSPGLIGFSGPADESPTQAPALGTEIAQEPVQLEDTEWALERYGPPGEESELLPGSTITLRFQDSQVSGTAGCNSYFGDYQLAGHSLSVGMLGSTEMWCEGLMDQESAYLALLREVETVSRQGDRLVLTGSDGRLVFAQQSLIADQSFVEILWELQTIVTGDTARSVLSGSRITIEFEADGRVSGNAGCNTFSSTYMLDEKGLGFQIFTTTLMACQDPEIMDQESLFLELLQESDSLSLQQGKLVISSDEGELVFQRASHLSFEGTNWVLTGISTGDAVVQSWIDEAITARFQNGQVTGSAGCNSYFADYAIDGSQLSLGPVASTRKACVEDVMQRETEFLSALPQVTSFETRLNVLRLYGDQRKLLLEFEAAE